MIDFQMEAIKVTESVCQSLYVNLDCAQTPRVRGETQNQPTHSTQSHAPPHAQSFSPQRSWFHRVTEDRREGRPLCSSQLHVPLATTSKLHPKNSHNTDNLTEVTQPSLIPNQYQILSCALCNISVRCLNIRFDLLEAMQM